MNFWTAEEEGQAKCWDVSRLKFCGAGWVSNEALGMDLISPALSKELGPSLWLDVGASQGPGLQTGFWAGLQGVRIQIGTLALTGGWSRELERWTMALLLPESLRLNVEAERAI